VLYEYEKVQQARQLLSQPAVLQALQQQLADCISSLQDEEILDIDSLLCGDNAQTQQQQQQQQQGTTAAKDWRSLVALQPVASGHRAFNPAAAQQQQQLLSVHARDAIQPGQLLGMYLGYVFDSKVDKRRMFKSAADREHYRYQYNFAVEPPRGAQQQPAQNCSSIANTNGSDCSNTPGLKQQQQQQQQRQQQQQQRQQQQQQTKHFLIDATCCLEGNSLAHMLDYQAFDRDSRSGRLAVPLAEQHSSNVPDGPNAMQLPLSDNSSGRVYCAVMALRGIAANEEVCIDYGGAYWEVSRVFAS
jgi:hypothetical protein